MKTHGPDDRDHNPNPLLSAPTPGYGLLCSPVVLSPFLSKWRSQLGCLKHSFHRMGRGREVRVVPTQWRKNTTAWGLGSQARDSSALRVWEVKYGLPFTSGALWLLRQFYFCGRNLKPKTTTNSNNKFQISTVAFCEVFNLAFVRLDPSKHLGATNLKVVLWKQMVTLARLFQCSRGTPEDSVPTEMWH